MESRSQIINPQTGVPFADADTVSTGPLTVEQFPPLADEELRVLRLTAENSLAAGHSPQVGVAFPLQAMIQIVVTVDELKARVAELEAELAHIDQAQDKDCSRLLRVEHLELPEDLGLTRVARPGEE